MNQFYDAIYLSPHLDDAALSCGGQIFQQTVAGKSILIVTLMAGEPGVHQALGPDRFSDFARKQHQKWQLENNVVARRKQEDRTACARLGTDCIHWDIPDCIYRLNPLTGEALYDSEDAIFGQLHPAEASLIDRTVKFLSALPEYGQMFVPLTAGHHVDHQLTRLAVEKTMLTNPLVYYEDYPYVEKKNNLTEALGENISWRSEVISLSASALNAKIQAISAYQSQLNGLFGGVEKMAFQVKNYASQVGGERVWTI